MSHDRVLNIVSALSSYTQLPFHYKQFPLPYRYVWCIGRGLKPTPSAYISKKYLNFGQNFYVPNQFVLRGQKSWKHDFEITGDPKGPPGGSTFSLGFLRPQTCKATPFVKAQKQSKITNMAQNRDFSIPIDR